MVQRKWAYLEGIFIGSNLLLSLVSVVGHLIVYCLFCTPNIIYKTLILLVYFIFAACYIIQCVRVYSILLLYPDNDSRILS